MNVSLILCPCLCNNESSKHWFLLISEVSVLKGLYLLDSVCADLRAILRASAASKNECTLETLCVKCNALLKSCSSSTDSVLSSLQSIKCRWSKDKCFLLRNVTAFFLLHFLGAWCIKNLNQITWQQWNLWNMWPLDFGIIKITNKFFPPSPLQIIV